jgi:gamma-glutamyltranspeptidase/glutathione hydrolase
MEDMKRYEPIWEEPQSTTWLGHTVFAPGKSNAGGYQLLESLNLAEELGVDRMGPYFSDPRAFTTVSRIVRKAIADSYTDEYLRQNGLASSLGDRISRPYAKKAAALMQADDPGPQKGPPEHTDAVVVIDRWGNIAALSHSINTLLWGTTGMVVDGIPIPDAAGFQQARLAGIKPGDPVPQDMASVIAMTGIRPVLAIASVGSSLIPETVRLVVLTLANQLDPLAAMAAPPVLLNLEPPKPGESFLTKPDLVPEGAYDPEFLERLQATGFKFEQRSKQEASAIKGTAVIGTIDPESGVFRGAETPGVFGFATAC